MAVAEAQRERAKTLKEMAQNSLFFFQSVTEYDPKAAQKHFTPEAAAVLRSMQERFAAIESRDWQRATLHALIQELSSSSGLALGKIAQPLRVAVSGSGVSPPIDVTLEVLGRDETLQRLQRAIAWIERQSR